MTSAEAWAVVRPDGTLFVVCVSELEAIDRAWILSSAKGRPYRAVRVRIEEVRE